MSSSPEEETLAKRISKILNQKDLPPEQRIEQMRQVHNEENAKNQKPIQPQTETNDYGKDLKQTAMKNKFLKEVQKLKKEDI